jgi:hypothetical protein
MSDDNVTKLADRRREMIRAAQLTYQPKEQPAGPFTVTITAPDGKMFEATFPDHTGNLPSDQPILGTVGASDLAVNLLAGALRAFAGAF